MILFSNDLIIQDLFLEMDVSKMSLKYVKCLGGGYHEGETMNLVCVDQHCDYRGLICPICRQESHEGHYILPIKTFLNKISLNFMNQPFQQLSSNISKYLSDLQSCKNQILMHIQNEIAYLSLLFKQIECKVQEEYLCIRRNVMIQCSFQTKFTNLIDIMRIDNHEEYDVQQEFKKYCQLIKYKDKQLIFSGRALNIMESVKQIPNKLKDKIRESMEIFKKELKMQTELLSIQIQKKKQNVFKYLSQQAKGKRQLILSQYMIINQKMNVNQFLRDKQI